MSVPVIRLTDEDLSDMTETLSSLRALKNDCGVLVASAEVSTTSGVVFTAELRLDEHIVRLDG